VIDVVVVGYRSGRTLDACLTAVHSIPGVGTVVVVDHSADPVTAAIAQRHGAQLHVDATNPGFGAGQNRGVAATASAFVLLVNPDARVIGDAIVRGVGVLESRPDAAAAQGVITGPDGPERSRGRELGPVHLWARALHLRRLLKVGPVRAVARRVPAVADHVDRSPSAVEDVEWLAATVLLVRRSAFDAVGGFDSAHYFLYGEDLDLCRRWRDAGYRLLAIPEPWASHLSGASSPTTWDRELVWWEGTMTFAARWWSAGALNVARTAAAFEWLQLAARRPRGARVAWNAMVRVRRSPASAPARPSPG
jgi:GT2 family glycosyltransferase